MGFPTVWRRPKCRSRARPLGAIELLVGDHVETAGAAQASRGAVAGWIGEASPVRAEAQVIEAAEMAVPPNFKLAARLRESGS